MEFYFLISKISSQLDDHMEWYLLLQLSKYALFKDSLFKTLLQIYLQTRSFNF